MSATNSSDIAARLKEALSARQRLRIPDEGRKLAAVLIPLYWREGTHHMVFTRRSELVSYHKGEISFPGGGVHKTDRSLQETALRESQEEIGLSPEDVEVLGELDDLVTKGSNYVVTPFVGLIQPGYKFKPSSFEIAEIIEIPVSGLLEKGCRREEYRIEPGGHTPSPYIYSYRNKEIVGATARMVKQFLDIYTTLIQPGGAGGCENK